MVDSYFGSVGNDVARYPTVDEDGLHGFPVGAAVNGWLTMFIGL